MEVTSSTLTLELRARGLAENLGGWHFALWTLDDLREAIGHFNQTVSLPARKIDLCVLLLQICQNEPTSSVLAHQIRRRREIARETHGDHEVGASSGINDATRKRNRPESIGTPGSPPTTKKLLSEFRSWANASRVKTPQHRQAPAKIQSNTDGPVSQLSHLQLDNDRVTTHNSPLSARQCVACTEQKSEADFPKVYATIACQHSTFSLCNECFTSYIGTQINSSELDRIRCPEFACNANLSFAYMQRYASPEVFAAYNKLLNKQAFNQMSDSFPCVNPACDYVFYGQAEDVIYMVCEACNTKTCHICNTLWHPGVSHAENQAEIAREEAERVRQHAGDEQATEGWVQDHAKICPDPRCGCKIEKIIGCDHMTCTRCKHEWCWDCLADHKPVAEYGNHMHRKECKHYRPMGKRGGGRMHQLPPDWDDDAMGEVSDEEDAADDADDADNASDADVYDIPDDEDYEDED